MALLFLSGILEEKINTTKLVEGVSYLRAKKNWSNIKRKAASLVMRAGGQV